MAGTPGKATAIWQENHPSKGHESIKIQAIVHGQQVCFRILLDLLIHKLDQYITTNKKL
jgi:hypothetical protein